MYTIEIEKYERKFNLEFYEINYEILDFHRYKRIGEEKYNFNFQSNQMNQYEIEYIKI